jgi:hypothetical protein
MDTVNTTAASGAALPQRSSWGDLAGTALHRASLDCDVRWLLLVTLACVGLLRAVAG